MYLDLVRKAILFLTIVSQAVLVFSQSENARAAIHDALDKSLELIDNRKLDSAQIFIDRSSELLPKKNLDSTLYFKHEITKAALVMRQGDAQTALGVFLTALPYFEKKKDSKNRALTLYQLGICQYSLNRRPVAEQYFKHAYELKDFLSLRLQTKTLQNLGTINLEEGMAQERKDLFEKAIENYEKAAKIYIQENWLSELSLCYGLWGECYIQLQDYENAIATIDKAIDIGKQAKNDNYVGFALIKKNSVYNKKKDYTSALKIIEEAIKIYQKSEDKNTLAYAYQQKKRSLDSLGKFEESSKLANDIWAITVTSYNERIANGIAEMETKYKTAEKEKEIAEQQLEIQNKNIFSLILGSSIIILAIIIIGLYKRHQFKQKQFQKEMDLKDALAQIKTQNRLQEQRLEISRDLHDNIGAQLTFIISSIDNLKLLSKETSDLFKEKLTNISGFTAETIGQLRDTIWAMNKNEIPFLELYSRLLSYIDKVKQITNNTHIEISQELSTAPQFSSVDGMNLFRVIQESINNAVKHAEASNIRVHFSEIDDLIQVSIKDDGKGFDKHNFTPGNGLSNIETRISSINGKVMVNSDVGQGTEILIHLKP